MRRLPKAAIFLCLFALTASSQSDEVEKVIEKVAAAYEAFTDVEMSFTQKKHISILKDPVESSGTVLWKTDRLLFRTEKPEKSEVLLTKEEILIWVPSSKKIEKYDRTKYKLTDTFDLGSGRNIKDMTSHYTVTIESKHPQLGEDENAILLKLVPKGGEKDLKKYIKEIWQWVRKKDHRLFRVEYTDTTGDRTVTTFDADKMKTNQGLTDDDVKLSAPDGTKIVDPLQPEDDEEE